MYNSNIALTFVSEIRNKPIRTDLAANPRITIMMTFKDVTFVGEGNSQDYSINFSSGDYLFFNIDDYECINEAFDEIIDFVERICKETISTEDANKAVEALKECYEINKNTSNRSGYIARLAELYCDDTIVAEAQLKDSFNNVEIYTLRFTTKKEGWKETTKAFVDLRNPSMVDFPSDWQSDYPISIFVNEEGDFEYPENFRIITLYMSEGKVHEY